MLLGNPAVALGSLAQRADKIKTVAAFVAEWQVYKRRLFGEPSAMPMGLGKTEVTINEQLLL